LSHKASYSTKIHVTFPALKTRENDKLSYNNSQLDRAAYMNIVSFSVASHIESLILSSSYLICGTIVVGTLHMVQLNTKRQSSPPLLPRFQRPRDQTHNPLTSRPRASSQLCPISQRYILPRLIKSTAPCPMRLARLHRVNGHVSYPPPRIALDDEARLVFIRLT
jgi:hypothetical protein